MENSIWANISVSVLVSASIGKLHGSGIGYRYWQKVTDTPHTFFFVYLYYIPFYDMLIYSQIQFSTPWNNEPLRHGYTIYIVDGFKISNI